MSIFSLTICAALAAPDAPSQHGERARLHATDLVTQVGPRPADEPAAEAAQDFVHERLRASGWRPRRLHTRYPAVVACRPGLDERVVLLLAHTDTVRESPGANDNAAAVGVLLAVAEALDEDSSVATGQPRYRSLAAAQPPGENTIG